MSHGEQESLEFTEYKLLTNTNCRPARFMPSPCHALLIVLIGLAKLVGAGVEAAV